MFGLSAYKLVFSRHPGMVLIYILFYFLERERSYALDLIAATHALPNGRIGMTYPEHYMLLCPFLCSGQ
jgi:hypothetical protein